MSGVAAKPLAANKHSKTRAKQVGNGKTYGNTDQIYEAADCPIAKTIKSQQGNCYKEKNIYKAKSGICVVSFLVLFQYD